MSGGVEASSLYLAVMFSSKRRILGLDLTFLLDWKKMGLGLWYGSVSFCRRRGVVDSQRKVLVSVLRWLIVMFLSSVQYRKL